MDIVAEDVVYLTRHGARIDSDDSEWLKKCNHNRSDYPHLSPSGHIAAQELAKRLRKTLPGNHIKHIISSPYIRCVQTANAIAEELNIQIKIEPGIAEVNSSRNPQFLDTEQLQEQFPSIDSSYTPVMTREGLPLEYSDGACANRSATAARKVRRKLTGAILFVGHGASCYGVADEFGHRGYVGCTSLTKFSQHDGGKYRLDGLVGGICVHGFFDVDATFMAGARVRGLFPPLARFFVNFEMTGHEEQSFGDVSHLTVNEQLWIVRGNKSESSLPHFLPETDTGLLFHGVCMEKGSFQCFGS